MDRTKAEELANRLADRLFDRVEQAGLLKHIIAEEIAMFMLAERMHIPSPLLKPASKAPVAIGIDPAGPGGEQTEVVVVTTSKDRSTPREALRSFAEQLKALDYKPRVKSREEKELAWIKASAEFEAKATTGIAIRRGWHDVVSAAAKDMSYSAKLNGISKAERRDLLEGKFEPYAGPVYGGAVE